MCMRVCGQERNESLCFMCVRERVLGESRALYIMAKEQVCVCVCFEWSVGESSKVEGQS